MPFQIGELNKTGGDTKPVFDLSAPGATLASFTETVKMVMERDVTKSARSAKGWQALCLRVDTLSYKTMSSAMHSAIRDRSVNKGISGHPNDIYVVIKAWVPEKMAASPLPETLPALTVEHKDHDWIDKFFPTNFIALQGEFPDPEPGHLVWVDFENENKFNVGTYNGLVNPKNPQKYFTNNDKKHSAKNAFSSAENPSTVIPPAGIPPTPVVSPEEAISQAIKKAPEKPKEPGVNIAAMFADRKKTESTIPVPKETREMVSAYNNDLKQIADLKAQGMSDYDAKCLVYGWDCEEGGDEYMG